MSERIQHMVIFCLKHPRGSAEAQQFLQDGRSILSSIPTVQDFRVYDQISPKNDFDYGFAMTFSGQADYDAYNEHPLHTDFVDNRWKVEVERFLEIDFSDYSK
ncbi:Dabb family protein [Paenibacillus puerhi]|uniref:Dabb family protein n=1 Tax=Paenibacillus puerhi TaxID=2692622 RepID=UPI0038B2D678